MTTLLAHAFEQANRLSDVDQNALAKRLLDELAAEREWDKAFSDSEDVLERLADETIEAKWQGKTAPLDLDRL